MQTLRTMPVDEAKRIADRYAQETIGIIRPTGAAENTDSGPAPCEGQHGEVAEDGRYYIQHLYVVPVSRDRQISTLELLQSSWERAGYEVLRLRRFQGEEAGEVAARIPGDGYQLSVESTSPPTAVSLAVYSPCFMPPDGVDPFRG
ncbi:MAG: hypothetical protein GEV03_10420 [Streptosporangiales bacterium]|nr:hypothetical protein [Streptosporangiales bacterium]